MESHKESIAEVSAQVSQFYQAQKPFRIYHGSTNSTRQLPHARSNIISTAHLTHVLDVDQENHVAVVEPNVPMDQLVESTMAHGLVPLVVMEFPGITAGGGFSGTSGESSSFRHGFFDATVNWIEIVLPTGEVLKASRQDHPDLFWGAASAFGTLGVITLLEVRLKPAKPFLELQYYSATAVDDAVRLFEDLTADPATEYLDGIVYAPDQTVVCAGRLTDSVPRTAAISRFTRPSDDWFYLHARQRAAAHTATASPPVDYIPLPDYLFRYDRGGFWVGRYAYQYFLVPFISLTRWLLDWFMHTRVMYHALHESEHSKQYIIQDVAVPYSATSEFVDWLDHKDNFGAYPIWLCPLKHSPAPGWMGASVPGNEYLMNFGLWAPSPYSHDRLGFVDQNRRLEQKVDALGGKKWLYAQAYYTEEEFWSVYDKKQYDAIRAKYHAGYLPDLYEKVRANLKGKYDGRPGLVAWMKRLVWDIWPVSGLVGVYKAWRGRDYLLRRKQ